MMKSAVNRQKKWGKSVLLAAMLLMVLSIAQPAFSQVDIIGTWATGTTHAKEAGTDRLLVVIAHAETAWNNTPSLSTVTYGGQTMTKIADKVQTGSTYVTRAYVGAFILDEAGVNAATSGTISASWGGSPTYTSLTSVFLGNVDQAILVGAYAIGGVTNAGTVTTSALSTNDVDMVIEGGTCTETGTYTANNGFTKDIDLGVTGFDGMDGHKAATGANETPSITHTTTSNRQAIIGFVVQGNDPNKASNPNPANGATNISVITNLSWTAGAGATSHDVYFGTNPNAHSNPKHTVYTTSYDPPGDLEFGTTYHWAVDANDDGIIYAGDDWNFTTLVPVTWVGDRVADYIVSLQFATYYATVCSFYGVLIYSEETGNTELKNDVITAYQPYYTGQLTPPEGDVDKNVFGILPFELYRQTGDANYLPLARHLADLEFANPRPDGLSSYTRFWIDDTYMIGSLQAQAYKATAEPNYANHAVTQLLGYMGEVEQLQQSNGLFHHTLSAPFFWGRGNGWAAAAMTEVLLSIPEDHPQRAQLLTKYQNMMSALVTYQDTSGMWFQLLDMGSDPRNWVESSCTGMFVFALATGVEKGWLPEEPYKQAALNGWFALENYVLPDGRVTEVCTGTGEGSTVQYYFDRPREIGNHHGQAAVIWAATAMEQLMRLKGDINADGNVDFYDLKILTDNWLGNEPSADIAPSEGDGIINFLDFAVFAKDWMK